MTSWAEKLAKWDAERAHPQDNRDNSAKTPLPHPSNGASVPIVSIVTASLPASVSMGLHRLRGGAPRQVANPAVWQEVVQDALRLRDDGWAVAALALGWSPLDLWGHSPDRDGLAVWLRGRSLVLVDERTAVVRDGASRAQFTRCQAGMPGSTLLWDMA